MERDTDRRGARMARGLNRIINVLLNVGISGIVGSLVP